MPGSDHVEPEAQGERRTQITLGEFAGDGRRAMSLRRLAVSPLAVAVLVFLLYAAFVVSIVRTTGIDTFMDEGSNFIARGHGDPSIRIVPGRHYDTVGYDGQFFYYIAMDPLGAAPYIDDPAYRYTRIAYPILARALAFGVEAAIPWSMVAINLAAITLGTLALAVWLRRRRCSVWLAAVFGLAPGMVVALQYDLSESMAYGLCAIGVLALDIKRPWLRVALAGLVFGVAGLTRELTVIYGVVFAAWILLRDGDSQSIQSRVSQAAFLAFITLAPYLVWRELLVHWFPGTGTPVQPFEIIPYFGLITWFFHPPTDTGVPDATFAVAIPGTIFGVWIAYLLWRARGRFIYGWLYLANVLPLVVFLGYPTYQDPLGVTRNTVGVILAAMLCVPFSYRAARERSIAVLSASSALWMSLTPLWLLVPILVYLHNVYHHRILH